MVKVANLVMKEIIKISIITEINSNLNNNKWVNINPIVSVMAHLVLVKELNQAQRNWQLNKNNFNRYKNTNKFLWEVLRQIHQVFKDQAAQMFI